MFSQMQPNVGETKQLLIAAGTPARIAAQAVQSQTRGSINPFTLCAPPSLRPDKDGPSARAAMLSRPGRSVRWRPMDPRWVLPVRSRDAERLLDVASRVSAGCAGHQRGEVAWTEALLDSLRPPLLCGLLLADQAPQCAPPAFAGVAGLDPATAGLRLSSPALCAFLARQETLVRPSSAALRACGCGPAVVALPTAIRPRGARS
jgi:hypothetical protein